LLLANFKLADASPPFIAIWFAFYAGQLALVSWAVARYIEPWPLRWIIWVWTMVLIDLQLAVVTAVEHVPTQALNCLGTGVLAGQLGALIVWGVLGSGPLVWRFPALAVLLLVGWRLYDVLVRLAHSGHWYQLGWNDLLWVQAIVLAGLCGILRLLGFKLAKAEGTLANTEEPGSARRSLQFSIRHVLIGTTSLAVALAAAKAGDVLTSRFLQNSYAAGLLFVALVAICTAAVLLVALWAALGEGSAVLRCLVLLLASLVLGAPIAWYCVFVGQLRMGRNFDFRLMHWYATGHWWIGWMFLAGTLLASLLILFRMLDYRLVRRL